VGSFYISLIESSYIVMLFGVCSKVNMPYYSIPKMGKREVVLVEECDYYSTKQNDGGYGILTQPVLLNRQHGIIYSNLLNSTQ